MQKNLKVKNQKLKYIFTVGRRKSASARVRLFKGKSISTVNGQEVKEVFYDKPFKITDTLNKYYFTAKVVGGGKEGQKEAIIHGLARALVKLDSEKYRSLLKTEGLLTRDSRVRLRRMVGMGGKSRRQRQSPKR